ncbi:MATH and LRR domain-containing protein PFE0570w [Cephus cinctus]|uniref:MATH and LRR domain-containing protein PFE0570w n=1 Tax=Cephus cinctus TaxID=211228 RepID=A0AAJ7C8W7_CEPCN|nr:MATH and LRR domain-containing protein PFE0570w [Cephus cinctus]
MKHVLLVFATFFCIVFGKRYPRDFTDSVGMIRRNYAGGTVPMNGLNFTREKNINLKKFYENSERVSIVDDRLKFNGTENSFKNYPKVNQFLLRRTMSRNNDLKTLSHQDHLKGNRNQDQKENSFKDLNKNKNIKEVINHDHVEENVHNDLKRTIDVDTILKLTAERLRNLSARMESQRKKTFLNEKPKYKRNDERGSNAHTRHSEWLILPNHNVNSINDFKKDSITDEYRSKSIVSSYRQPGVIIKKNQMLSHGQSDLLKSDNDKGRNVVNYQNSNFNVQDMKKSENPNVLNTGRRNPDIFKYKITGMRKGKGFENLGSRIPNMRNMQNENTDIQDGINFEKRNFEKIVADDSQVANLTVRSPTDYPSLNNSQYPKFDEQDTVDYENLKFGKQSLRDFAESEIPTTRNNMENSEINIPTSNSVSQQFETSWESKNGVNAKSILENRTKFQTFSFEPGQPNQYPVLREIYRKDLDSNFQLSSKKERRGIPVDDPYYFDRENFENLPAGEIFHESRVVVENSIVPTKLYAKDDLEKVLKSVRFFLDHRIKREDYYRLPLKENKKDSTISSKKFSKNHSKLGNDKEEVSKIRNSNEQKSRKKKISNKVPSPTKDSIRNRYIDERSLNLKDHVHDYYFQEELLTKAEEQDDFSDSTLHENHTSSLNLKNIPKTTDMVIFKREIDKTESARENPSSSNLTVSERIQKNFESINSRNKFKIKKKRTHKDEKDRKKVSKIGLKTKVSKKNHRKANKNDPSKFKPDDTKEVKLKIKVNIPEQDHQAPDFNNDRVKTEYFPMTNSVMEDALNEDHLNKNMAIPVKINENDLMDDFITYKNTPLLSMGPIAKKNKEGKETQSKRKLIARDKPTDDDFGLYGSIESDLSMDSNLKDDKFQESNHESKSSVPVDDTEGFMETNNAPLPINPPNSQDSRRLLDNDQITPFRRNNLIYKPYGMEGESRSMKKRLRIKQLVSEPDFIRFINTSSIRLAAPDYLKPIDVNFEAHGKQPCTTSNKKGMDECSEEESGEAKNVHDDEKKTWPISPGPITCNPDYEVTTTFGTEPTEYPFVVSIQYQNIVTKNLSHICNGVVVGTRFILSAAHCLNNRDNFELVVQRSNDLCDDEEKPVPVALVMEHENYNRHTRMNDLALLRLKYEIDTDQVSFPKNDIIFNDFYSVGWGELMWNRFAKNVTKIQQKLPVSRYSDKTKENAGTIYMSIAGLDITGTFRGDYGGILLNEDKELIGVQSKFYPDENYEVFMRVRTYLPWIENMINSSKRLLEHPYKFQPKKG